MKFSFSEKATKIGSYLPLDLTFTNYLEKQKSFAPKKYSQNSSFFDQYIDLDGTILEWRFCVDSQLRRRKWIEARCGSVMEFLSCFYHKVKFFGSTKSQLISKCPFGIIVWTKYQRNYFWISALIFFLLLPGGFLEAFLASWGLS